MQFRRECRKLFPNEHFGVLHGSRNAVGDIFITKIAAVYHKPDPGAIHVEESDIYRSKRAALRQDSDWIGTIHSHCSNPPDNDVCWHLSNADIRSALQWGESICGVVYVDSDGRRSFVHWYVPSPIPAVAYI